MNRGDKDVLLLVVGDRSGGDKIDYPDIDMLGRVQPDGSFRFVHQDGTPY